MRIAVFGAGLVGRRTAAFVAAAGVHEVLLVSQRRPVAPLTNVITAVGWPNRVATEAELVVLATESSHQFSLARELLQAGTSVICTADDPVAVERLWSLGDLAQAQNATLVVGAAYSPGVSTLLASFLASQLDEVDAISTAQFGTGGPACAREHHRAMSRSAVEVHRGLLRESRGGSGRELVWFPDPVGPADCYRGGLADPFLLHQAFPGVRRIESRQAATRRDRLTARLPMLRSPHPEGLVGAVWVEVRGRAGGRVEHRAMAATAPQATAAAAMAAAFCGVIGSDEGMRPGTQSAATSENMISLLKHVSNEMRLWTYDGSHVVAKSGVYEPPQAARKWRISGENVEVPTIP